MCANFLTRQLRFDNPATFAEAWEGIELETLGKGRVGGVLVAPDDNGDVPLMRTTTSYRAPAQRMTPFHYEIIKKIKEAYKDLDEKMEFNNALMEVYTDEYRRMGWHTDQGQDLADDSYIAVFSTYERPTHGLRKLVVQNKITESSRNIFMEHNSVVLFSSKVNREHVHKILLHQQKLMNGRWLGITFRLSKTLLKYADGGPFFAQTPGRTLRMATDQEKVEFRKLKGAENSSTDFVWPELDYTISMSDMVPCK